AATTEIVTEATETAEDPPAAPPARAPDASQRPRARPDRDVEAAAAEAQDEAAEPDPAPREDAPDKPEEEEVPPAPPEDAIAQAAAEAVAQALSRPETDEETRPSTPAAPPLTSGERDALRLSVQRCWNVGALSTEALGVTVTVAFSLDRDGTPQAGSLRMAAATGGSDAAAQQAYGAARRAVLRCGADGFDLPPEKYDQWRDIEMVFNPESMRIR
ncbi:hypothetical protein C2I36_16310, partial [Rhodobacteraceae bacterium WD3A24]